MQDEILLVYTKDFGSPRQQNVTHFNAQDAMNRLIDLASRSSNYTIFCLGDEECPAEEDYENLIFDGTLADAVRIYNEVYSGNGERVEAFKITP